jgi:Cu-Zn family superoxide dismutase
MQRSKRVRALTLVGAVALAGAAAGCSKHGHPRPGDGPGHGHGKPTPTLIPTTDLAPTAANPTDGTSAGYTVKAKGDSTTVTLYVTGFAAELAGTTFGAHVHKGTCVAGDGAAAGPHYANGTPPSKTTEVWLDITVGADGKATSTATVPFSIPAGAAQAIVIHEKATAADGTAGGRFACIPFQAIGGPAATTTTTSAPGETTTTMAMPATTTTMAMPATTTTTAAPATTTTMDMNHGDHGH